MITTEFEVDYFTVSLPYQYRTGCYPKSCIDSTCNHSKRKDATLTVLILLNIMQDLTSTGTLI